MDKIKNFFAKYWRTVVGIAFLVAVLITMFFLGNIKVTLNDESIKLDSMFVSASEINYDDIESVKIETNIDTGSRSVGFASTKIKAGSYKNQQFGNYKLYSYSKVSKYVVIKTSDKYYVYNLSTEKLTEDSYNELLEKINN